MHQLKRTYFGRYNRYPSQILKQKHGGFLLEIIVQVTQPISSPLSDQTLSNIATTIIEQKNFFYGVVDT